MKLLRLTRKNGDPICILAGNGTRFGIHRQYDHHGHEYAKDNAVWPVGCQEPEHVTETPDQIAAMLAEPAAPDSRHIPTMGQALVAIEPMAGAGVRTLPTPDGGKRFLCLPDVDLTKPVEHDGWYALAHGDTMRTMFLHMCVGHKWNTGMTEPWDTPTGTVAIAAYGPLPQVKP
jgi:hypothetical protein